jgi:putative membrane protein
VIYYDPHRWLNRLFDIHGSMVKEIGPRLGLCLLWTAGLAALHQAGYVEGMPATLHSLVGVALGLLLVFRTNSSYDRYWEGRKLWGGIVNESRNLIRSSSVHLAGHPRLLQAITRWAALFPWVAANSLRGETYLGPMAHQLPPQEVEAILNSQHSPLYVAQRISGLLAEARSRALVSDVVFVYLDQNVQQLIDNIGGCERIRKTPLPFAYVIHLRRTLIMYCFTLPFALVRELGWFSILAEFMVTFMLFGIEEIGVEIEGPFGDDENDLPMQEYCTTIHNNLYAMAGISHPPAEPLPEG